MNGFCSALALKDQPTQPCPAELDVLMMVKQVSLAKRHAKSLHILFHGQKAPTPYMSIIMLIKATQLPAKPIPIQSSCGAIQSAIIHLYWPFQ